MDSAEAEERVEATPEEQDAPILVLRDRKVVGRIDAERSWPKVPDYTRFDPIMGQASDGTVYSMFQENHNGYSGKKDAWAQRRLWSAVTSHRTPHARCVRNG